MQYQGCLLAVRDMAVSKRFYEALLHQTAQMDVGAHVSYEGFSLQQDYAGLIGVAEQRVIAQAHNFQLYFEVADLDAVYAELKRAPEIQWLHEIKEYPWGRDLRIYDPDGHVVEIAENIGAVVARLLARGMSVQEIAAHTLYPIEAVQQAIE